MNYIALRNRFSNPLLSYLVLISSSFRSSSKTKISTLKVNLKLFLCHWKLAPFGERIEVMLSGLLHFMSCLSGSTCLFVLFGFSFFVCVEIREHIIKSFVTFACFGLNIVHLLLYFFFKLTRMQVGACS